jgi:hypothetical protein
MQAGRVSQLAFQPCTGLNNRVRKTPQLPSAVSNAFQPKTDNAVFRLRSCYGVQVKALASLPFRNGPSLVAYCRLAQPKSMPSWLTRNGIESQMRLKRALFMFSTGDFHHSPKPVLKYPK